MPSSKAITVTLSEEERAVLERWVRRGKTAQRLVMRSRVVLLAAKGLSNSEIARRFDTCACTSRKWRGRFAKQRLDGLLDEPRPGAPRSITDADVERVIVRTL